MHERAVQGCCRKKTPGLRGESDILEAELAQNVSSLCTCNSCLSCDTLTHLHCRGARSHACGMKPVQAAIGRTHSVIGLGRIKPSTHGRGTKQIMHLSYWYESDDQFPKLHSSAKLCKMSGSVCAYESVSKMCQHACRGYRYIMHFPFLRES